MNNISDGKVPPLPFFKRLINMFYGNCNPTSVDYCNGSEKNIMTIYRKIKSLRLVYVEKRSKKFTNPNIIKLKNDGETLSSFRKSNKVYSRSKLGSCSLSVSSLDENFKMNYRPSLKTKNQKQNNLNEDNSDNRPASMIFMKNKVTPSYSSKGGTEIYFIDKSIQQTIPESILDTVKTKKSLGVLKDSSYTTENPGKCFSAPSSSRKFVNNSLN